jgi:hypothetical protein
MPKDKQAWKSDKKLSFLLGLFFDPENGGEVILRNVD